MPSRSCLPCSGRTAKPASRPADLRGEPHCPSELFLSNPEAGTLKVSQATGGSGSQRARTLLCAPGKHIHRGLGSHLPTATELTGLCPLCHREKGEEADTEEPFPPLGAPQAAHQPGPDDTGDPDSFH